MDWTTVVFLVCVAGYTAVAAACDLWTKKLPNRLTVTGLVAALAFHGLTGGWSGLVTAVGGFATGFGILLVLWIIGGGGGGDVKLMGALGAWLGPQWTLSVFLLSALLVLIGGIGLMMSQFFGRGIGYVQRRYLSRTRRTRGARSAGDSDSQSRRRVLPYAVPVALGTWLVLSWNLLVAGG